MELEKRKYAREEVRRIIDDTVLGYEERLAEQKGRIAELVKDNKEMSEKLAAYEYKDKLIAEAVKKSEEYLAEAKEKADKEYALNTEYLENFLDKWNKYFGYLAEKYPMYEVVKNAEALKNKLQDLLGSEDNRKIAKELSAEIGAKGKDAFDPKGKIKEYIALTDESGVNMDEVLNPGELHLEDICKELGLLEENG